MTYLRTEFLKGINPAQAGVNHPRTSLGPQGLDWQEDVRRHSGQVGAVLMRKCVVEKWEGKSGAVHVPWRETGWKKRKW